MKSPVHVVVPPLFNVHVMDDLIVGRKEVKYESRMHSIKGFQLFIANHRHSCALFMKKQTNIIIVDSLKLA
jgi:hypothetical protein